MTLPYRSVVTTAVLLASLAHGQEFTHFTGGAAPTEESVMEISWEDFTLTKEGDTLPTNVDLRKWFPPAGNQSKQASCSGWALGYALGTYFWNRKVGRTADTTYLGDPANTFSPAFVYNLTKKKEQRADCDEGVELSKAIQLVCDTGCCTWMQFPYDTTLSECVRLVPDTVMRGAMRHRMTSPTQIDNRNWVQWMFHLSSHEPIIFLASVGDYFEEKGVATKGKAAFNWDEPFPTRWDGRRGHIMVCVGYDVRGGDTTFLALNSWGRDWGDDGYVLIPDSTMYWACSEAYVLQPGKAPVDVTPTRVERKIDFGRDQQVARKFRMGEVHTADGIMLRFVGASPDGKRQIVDYWDLNSPERIETISLLEGQPTTFQHYGNVYTFTYSGLSWLRGLPRYTLVKEDPLDNELRRRVDSMFTPRVQ